MDGQNGDSDGDAGASEAPPSGPTYYGDLLPVLSRNCLGCHVDGGIAPFALDRFETARDYAIAMLAAVESGRMPPWPADDECLSYEGSRRLEPKDRKLFRAWFEAGMARGNEREAVKSKPADAFEPTHTAHMTEPYRPAPDVSDDYRCFVMDLDFPRDSFVVGRNVVPGQPSLVHHVLLYAADGSFADAIQAADDAAKGPGYTCFGGPLPQAETASDSSRDTSALSMVQLGGWVPGQVPFEHRKGRGTFVPKGSKLIMQVHYNLLENNPSKDETYVELALSFEEPDHGVVATPLAIVDLEIPAGDTVREERVFWNYRSEALSIVGVTPHMHLLGTSISAERVPRSGSNAEPQCLIDIPRWDFEWQQSYVVEERETVVVKPGEGIKVACTYDNTEAHQPIVNGVQQEPRDVSWGESTLDEMCLVYINEESPWTGPLPRGCDAAEACLAGCQKTDTECLLDCEGLDGACRACSLRATLGCATEPCLVELVTAGECIRECIDSFVLLGGSYTDCVSDRCGDVGQAAIQCAAGVVEGGACDEQLGACGISRSAP